MNEYRLEHPKHPQLGYSMRTSGKNQWPQIVSFFWLLYQLRRCFRTSLWCPRSIVWKSKRRTQISRSGTAIPSCKIWTASFSCPDHSAAQGGKWNWNQMIRVCFLSYFYSIQRQTLRWEKRPRRSSTRASWASSSSSWPFVARKPQRRQAPLRQSQMHIRWLSNFVSSNHIIIILNL